MKIKNKKGITNRKRIFFFVGIIVIIILIFLLFSFYFNTSKNSNKKFQSITITDTIYDMPMTLVYVQGGTFKMGCTYGLRLYCNGNEKPVHLVTVSDFYIGKVEITQALWEAVMGNNPSSIIGKNLPVDQVTWYEVQNFIQKLNTITGKKYRLPTEAEWEFAAKGGNRSKGYKYSGSNNLSKVAWCFENADNSQPVGTKMPNELGIYDMSGNVWEWCYDFYDLYSKNPQTNPYGPVSGRSHIWRGGALNKSSQEYTVSNRNYCDPERTGICGFRLVLTPEK